MMPHLQFIPSPPQGVWHLGPIALRAYAGFIIAGIVIAVWWGGRRYVTRGGKPGRIADLAVFAVPFGLIGGRLYHVITDHELYFGPGRNPWRALAIWEGGLGIWGAIALGAVGIWWGCRHYKIPMAPVADALAPGIVVAQAIGRLGNYFNQELFGSPTTVPWALQVYVRTPNGGPSTGQFAVDACEFPTEYIKANPEVLCGAGTYHPTFLYELLWNLAVAALIVWADKRFRLGGGRVFALYVAGYTAGRAWIEALRIDPARTHLFGLRVNIVVSIVVFCLAVGYLLARRRAGREEPTYVAGTATDPQGSGVVADTQITDAQAGTAGDTIEHAVGTSVAEPEAGSTTRSSGTAAEQADHARAATTEVEPAVSKPGSGAGAEADIAEAESGIGKSGSGVPAAGSDPTMTDRHGSAPDNAETERPGG